MGQRWFGCVVGVGMWMALSAHAAETRRLVLVKEGRPDASIVIARKATRAAQFAAFELQWHVKQITGATLPIVTDDKTCRGTRVLVGASRAAAALGVEADQFTKPQEYLIRFLPDTLVLMGKDAADTTRVIYDEADPNRSRTWPEFLDAQATCYAVYDFLERHCNVRWFLPNELGLVCPNTKTLTVTGTEVRRQPAFLYRQLAFNPRQSEKYERDRVNGLWSYPNHPEKYEAMDAIAWANLKRRWPNPRRFLLARRGQVRLFLHRMRHGGEQYACNHSFYGYYGRYLKAHPDWFAKGYPGRPPQSCYINPGFINQVIQDARDYFDGKGAKPGAQAAGDYFGLVPMDNSSWCKCAKCQSQLDASAKSAQFSNGWASEYVFEFTNKVARAVGKTHPDKILSQLAYSSYAYRPKRVKLEPNVSIGFCLHIRNVYAPKIQANDLKLIKEWLDHEKGRRFFLFLYYCFPVHNTRSGANTWHCFPGFFAHQVGRMFRLYHRGGVRGALFDGFGHDVDSYVTFRVLDDPSRDVDAILDEYFTRLYGPAAGPMKAFYLEIENAYCNPANYPPGYNTHQSRHIAWKYLGTPQRMAKLARLMQQARQAARTDVQKKRVAFWEKSIWDYMLAGRRLYDEQQNTPLRKVRAPRVPGSAAAGDPAKVDWSKSAVLDKWVLASGKPTPRKLSGRIVHDGTFLYLELQERIDPKTLVRGGDLWDGDDWEIFAAAQRSKPYRQMGISPTGWHMGLTYDEPGGNKWKCGAKVVSDVTAPDRWTVRMALPLADLVPGGAKPGQTIYMNFTRVSWRGGLNVHCWCPTFTGPRAPDRFGAVTLD